MVEKSATYIRPGSLRSTLLAYGMVFVPQNPSTGNGRIPGVLSVAPLGAILSRSKTVAVLGDSLMRQVCASTSMFTYTGETSALKRGSILDLTENLVLDCGHLEMKPNTPVRGFCADEIF